MILKSFEKVNVETRNEYTVFDANGSYVESFYKDFLDKDNKIFADGESHCDWGKLFKYEQATVNHVSWNKARQCLSISVTAKWLKSE